MTNTRDEKRIEEKRGEEKRMEGKGRQIEIQRQDQTKYRLKNAAQDSKKEEGNINLEQTDIALSLSCLCLSFCLQVFALSVLSSSAVSSGRGFSILCCLVFVSLT
jgi:hypothetical protein